MLIIGSGGAAMLAAQTLREDCFAGRNPHGQSGDDAALRSRVLKQIHSLLPAGERKDAAA